MNIKQTNKQATFMKVLKSIHSLKDNLDLNKQRRSQDTLGLLFSPKHLVKYDAFEIDGMNVEWIRKNKKAEKSENSKVILYFHGGAYLTGSLNYARVIGAKLCLYTDIDVLSIDYRLAPENPYPAQLDDAHKAYNYLCGLGYDPKNIILAGESAGGNLVLCLTHFLKFHSQELPGALICMSPWTDLTASGKSYQSKKDIDPMLTYAFLQEATYDYATTNDLTIPTISPLFGDFTDFPPTLIQVGSNEILLSDSVNVKDKMLECNVNCKLEIWKDMWHVFQMFPIKKASKAMKNIDAFIKSVF